MSPTNLSSVPHEKRDLVDLIECNRVTAVAAPSFQIDLAADAGVITFGDRIGLINEGNGIFFVRYGNFLWKRRILYRAHCHDQRHGHDELA
jgi:hypothetical protein